MKYCIIFFAFLPFLCFSQAQQVNSIGGAIGVNPVMIKSTAQTIWVQSLSDLPAPVSGVITLKKDHTYAISGKLDLLGNRLVTSGRNAIHGSSSETQEICSTGLPAGTALIESDSSLVLKDISVKHAYPFNFTAFGSNEVLIWSGMNVVNATTSVISGFSVNMSGCAFLESSGFTIDGVISSFAVQNSMFNAGGGTIFTFPSTAAVSTRIRFAYSSFICSGSESALNINTVVVANERFVLSHCNFSGGGPYLSGIDHTSPKSLFTFNTGISNTLDFTAWDTNVANDFSGSWNDLTSKPSAFQPTPHTHTVADITGLPNTQVYIPLAANFSNTTVTLNPTGITFPVLANKTYIVEIQGSFTSTATTTGIGLALDVPVAATVAGIVQNQLGATTDSSHGQVADAAISGTTTTNGTGTSGVPYTTNPVPITGRWVVKTGATAGTVILLMRSEIAASSVTLNSGVTVLSYRQID